MTNAVLQLHDCDSLVIASSSVHVLPVEILQTAAAFPELPTSSGLDTPGWVIRLRLGAEIRRSDGV